LRLNNAVFAPPALSKEKDMGGFNYGGGKGDGTDWSSEKGDTPEPGGGSNGNGGRDSGNDNSQAGAFQRQMTAVLNDPAIKSMLADLQKRALRISPSAKVELVSVDARGLLSISLSGMRREQSLAVEMAFQSVRPRIKGDLISSFTTSEGTVNENTHYLGKVETGYRLGDYERGPSGNNGDANTVAENNVTFSAYSSVFQGKIPPGYWLNNNKVMTEVVIEYEINGGGKETVGRGTEKPQ
jgi:hypothetical protein